MYTEVRDYLRQQHVMNTEEIHGKKVDNFKNYRYYEKDVVKNEKTGSSFFSIMFKTFFFLTCVMVFSFYIYGEQNVGKGASMAWDELKEQIVQMENEKPAVKQTMSYIRKVYDEVEDFAKTYINEGD